MKSEKLLNSIGNIDDQLVENAGKENQNSIGNTDKVMKMNEGTNEQRKITKPWKIGRFSVGIAASLVLLCGGAVGFYAYDNATIGGLTLDVNPGVELTVARNGKVKQVCFINEDARDAFNGVKVKKDSVESFVKQTIELYKNLGYVVDEDNTILVSFDKKISDNEELKNRIKKSIQSALDNVYAGELFFHQNSGSEEAKKLAKEHEISEGKADWILSTANTTGQNIDELVELSVEELGQWQTEPSVPFGSRFIGITKAKQIAISDAGVSSKIKFITEKLYDGGIKTPYYLLEFGDAENYWKYRIDATNGSILEKENIGKEVEKMITLQRAKEIAEADAFISESTKIIYTEEYLKRNNGRPCYVLSFHTADNNYFYHYEIDANTGDILESRYIGIERAKQIALNDASPSARITFTKTFLIDGGIKTPYYLIEFKNNQFKWSYQISATDGKILKSEKNGLDVATMITMEEAKMIALEDANLNSDVKIEYTEEDLIRNSGEPYYSLKFKTIDEQYFFYYKIDAYSGEILERRYIGYDKAIEIALLHARPELKVTFTNKSLVDGGIKTPYYLIEFENTEYNYYYKIDATNGGILESKCVKQSKEN